MALSPRRLRALAMIALANALVVVITLFSGWTLTEAALAYFGEFVVLVFLAYARLLVAKRLPDSINQSRWDLRKAQLLAIGVTLPLYALFAGIIFLLLYGRAILLDLGAPLTEGTLQGLLLCWAGFLVTHLFAFVENYRRGAYDELLSDGRMMAQMWRYPPLLLASLVVAATTTDGVAIVPWVFVGVLAVLASVDTALYIVEQDAVNAALRQGQRRDQRALQSERNTRAALD